jgi:ribosome-associated toxin RatA of RatAB toxin-antitoxin module
VSPLKSLRRLAALCGTLLCLCASAFAGDSHDDIEVRVERRGDVLVVDATLTVEATPEEAWAVLIDFDHMAQFISNLEKSRILSSSGNAMRVEQNGRSSHGPFALVFASVKDYELKPYESIRSRLVSGTFKKFDGLTTLSRVGSGVRLDYHGESIPDMWIPPLIGPVMVRNEVAEQFRELRNEILRRRKNPLPN